MSEMVTDSVRILDALNFKPRCEKWWHVDPKRCTEPAVALVTFASELDVVVSRLACKGCWADLEGLGRVYGVKKL